MPNKKVFVHFESDPFYRINLEMILRDLGQVVTAYATNIAETKELLKKITEKRIIPDVAIVPNYLERDWRDGELLTKRLREISKGITIISYSVVREKPEWADLYAVKSALDNETSLLAALRKVLGIKEPE